MRGHEFKSQHWIFPLFEGHSNYLSCSSSCSGHLVNLLLGCTFRGAGGYLWFKSGPRLSANPGLVCCEIVLMFKKTEND